MANFSSNDVNVFPSMWRQFKPQSKFTNEENFTNILKSVTDKDSYIVDYNNGTLKCVIYGYYFEINNFNLEPDYTLYIVVDQNGTLINPIQGTPHTMDSNGECLFITSSEPQLPTGATLHELDITDSNSQILTKSLTKVNSNSVYFADLDSQSLTSKIDEKQDNLTSGRFIEIDSSENISVVNNTLNSLYDGSTYLSKGGDGKTLVYFGNGQALESSTSVGQEWTQGQNESHEQTIILKDGKITGGITIYASTEQPSDVIGSPGDIWFKYQDNSNS